MHHRRTVEAYIDLCVDFIATVLTADAHAKTRDRFLRALRC